MFLIKYGPETLNEFEDFDTTVDELIFQRVENPDLRMYILDTDSDSRFDIEDVEGINPRWNESATTLRHARDTGSFCSM